MRAILDQPLFLAYLAVINVAAFFIYAYDKYCAIHNKWRIPEKVLLLLVVFGGGMGGLWRDETLSAQDAAYKVPLWCPSHHVAPSGGTHLSEIRKVPYFSASSV